MSFKRKSELDLVRTLAIILAVLNHAVETVFPMGDLDFVNLPLMLQLVACTGFTLGRIGVPLFLFLSGLLLLNREYTKESIVLFYKHNFLPLLLVWEAWILLYNVFLSWFNNTPFSVVRYLCNAALISDIGIMHEWYMPMILGMYLFIPVVSIALHKMSDKMICFFITVVYVHFFVLNYALRVLSKLTDLPLNWKLDFSFSGGVYGLYLITGYLIAKKLPKIMGCITKKGYLKGGLICTAAIMIVFTVGVQVISRKANVVYNVWYDFPAIPIIATCFFLLLLRENNMSNRVKNNLYVLSTCAFGVYLIHVPILKVIYTAFAETKICIVNKMLGLFIADLFFSFFSVCLSRKTKYLKRLFLIS